MTKYIRIDKREARRVYENGGTVVMSLNKPEVPMGDPVEFDGVTTCSKNGTGGQTFDKLAEDGIQWKHRYPGSQGLVWYTPAPEPLTPYDTGKRAEPRVWEERHRESEDDFGKVDFNDDVDYTVATLYIELQPDSKGYVLKGYTNEPLKVEIDDQSDGDEAAPAEGVQGISTIHWFPGDLVEWAHNDAYGAKVWDYGVVGMIERTLGSTTLWVYVPGHTDPRQWPAAQCRLLRRNNPNKEGQ